MTQDALSNELTGIGLASFVSEDKLPFWEDGGPWP